MQIAINPHKSPKTASIHSSSFFTSSYVLCFPLRPVHLTLDSATGQRMLGRAEKGTGSEQAPKAQEPL